MIDDESKRNLLSQVDSEYALEAGRNKLNQKSHGGFKSIFTTTLLAISLVGNVALFDYAYRSSKRADVCRSEFTGLGKTADTEYKTYTDYMNLNLSISDPLWDAMDSSPIVVALDKDYIQAHGLEESIPLPWDQSKGIYHVKAFHHMHCLKVIRRAYNDAFDAKPVLLQRDHVNHCFDTLRQDLRCNADDTPMPTINKLHHIGNGQTHKCKDWDALVRWTQEPVRQSCFHMLSDYRTVPHSLEQFDYCPEGSPYRDVAKKYFEKWGHKNPYGDDESEGEVTGKGKVA